MRRTPRRATLALTSALTAALALTMVPAVSASAATPLATKVVSKGTLTLAFETDPYGWDPANQPGYQNWQAEAVWDRLIYCNASGQADPGAAASWKISGQNSTFTAKLRPGMKFSDGTPVNSKAVAASFVYVMNNGGQTGDYKGLKIGTPDPLTVVLTWPEPQAVLVNKVCNPYIVPSKYLKAKKFDAPYGSGPYIFDVKKSTTGSVYTFNKNPKHWNAKNYPYNKLVIKVIKNPAAAVAALKTGQVDAGLVGASDVTSIAASGLTIKAFKGQTTRLLLTDHLGKVIPALGNVKVRQAINMVFDKAAMAKNLYLGLATPAFQVFREGSDAYIPNLQDPYPFNVAKAKQLMADAGYANGFSIELPTIDGQNFETLIPYVTQQLALINITAKEVRLSGANAIGDLLSGKYPVVLWQLGNMGNSGFQIYIESTPGGWWDLEHQPDQYVDSRYAQLATATPAQSKKLQQEINRYIIDQAWQAPMVSMGSNFAYNPKKLSIPTESDQEALTPRLRDFK